MATTTCSIAISSPDIMSSQTVNISKSATLKQAGKANLGIENTTGLAMKTLESSSKVDLITYDADDISGNAAKFYIRNTSSSSSQYVTILINSEEIGRLYGGDFAFFPYTGGSNEDIEVQPSTSAKVILEYIAFY